MNMKDSRKLLLWNIANLAGDMHDDIIDGKEFEEKAELLLCEFLNTEKEIVVLDAPAASDGVYSDVRNSECEADSTDAIEHTSGATLETRIDSGNKICSRCKQPYTKEELFEKEHCYYCGNREDFEEES